MSDHWDVEGPDAVPGVAERRAQGFEPVEEHTGALWVADQWPDQFKCSVRETRQLWLDNETQTHDRVCLVRSPWPALTVHDVFAVLWTWIERDHQPMNPAIVRAEAAEVLAWDELRATGWHALLPSE